MLRILFSKPADGSTVLRCIRENGSETWQKQDRHAAFLVPHDLTHLAVESVLGIRQGFFGLIASGWEIAETDGKSKRGELPAEAIDAEFLVGTFDTERAGPVLWTAAEFNESMGVRGSARPVTDEEIAEVRKRRSQLFARWAAIESGGILELTFQS